jgi:hypothetical protein
VFEGFVNDLISSSFYLTEAEGRGSEVLFYRSVGVSFRVRVWVRIGQGLGLGKD